jgi:phosphonate transport system substrate-binding protein
MPLVFATGPQGLGSRGGELRAGLAEVLTRRLGEEVQLFACGSYSELLSSVERASAAMAWLPPAVYVQAQEVADVKLLARSVRHGARTFRGAVFVKAGSRATSVEDLEGKHVGWVDPHSCAGHLLPRKAVIDAGRDPDIHFGSQSFIGSHRGVARAVHGGEVDAGATYVHLDPTEEILSAGWRGVDDDDAFRVLLVSDEVPADAIGTTVALPTELRPKLKEVLLGLGADDAVRPLIEGLFQCVAFDEPDPEAYRIVQELRRSIRLL